MVGPREASTNSTRHKCSKRAEAPAVALGWNYGRSRGELRNLPKREGGVRRADVRLEQEVKRKDSEQRLVNRAFRNGILPRQRTGEDASNHLRRSNRSEERFPHVLERKAQTVQKLRATLRRIFCGRILTSLPTRRKLEHDHWERGLRRL